MNLCPIRIGAGMSIMIWPWPILGYLTHGYLGNFALMVEHCTSNVPHGAQYAQKNDD
ncbi:MAG: hypothetical protein ACP5O1_05410 [Phycisphaerae bacterium]